MTEHHHHLMVLQRECLLNLLEIILHIYPVKSPLKASQKVRPVQKTNCEGDYMNLLSITFIVNQLDF